MTARNRRDPNSNRVRTRDALQRGRESYAALAWTDAYKSLLRADQETPLEVEDVELLAMSAYLIGRDDDYLRTLERAHRAHVDASQWSRAARCAFWLGLRLLLRGETGPATGWLTRAHRLLDKQKHDSVERGYLLLPAVLQHIEAKEWETAYRIAADAAEIGERFREAELVAAAQLLQGRALMLQGQVDKGLAYLDEAMVAVAAGDLSPMVTGLIYCSVIDGCQQVYAFGRAREWTAALAEWCEKQPEVVFTGRCLVHRAEIMQLHGAWQDAIEAARRACEHFSHRVDHQAAAAALYQEAEVHRLQGEFADAEQKYRSASQWGWEPQPGLALLRLAQGRTEAAAAAIRRVVDTTADRLQRVRFLPAYIEIMLAAGDMEAARGACRELESVAESFDAGMLSAIAAHARGVVALAEGDAQAALAPLRCAFEAWQEVEAPYLAARVRVQIGLACRARGDEDGAGLELDAARAVFQQLNAAPDLARIHTLCEAGSSSARPHGLTRRELQVLRLLATGKTNRTIAAELFVSEKTIDRHVSNIFDKLDVPSRAAATGYAYKHKII